MFNFSHFLVLLEHVPKSVCVRLWDHHVFQYAALKKYSSTRQISDFEIVSITPKESHVVAQYLRANKFKDDPMARAMSMAGTADRLEKIITEKVKEGGGMMAIAPSEKNKPLNVVAIGIGSTFGVIENDLTYKLSNITQDNEVKSFLKFLSYMKHLANIPEAIDQPIWDINIFLNDGIVNNYTIGKILTKHMMVLGKELGHSHGRIDCACPASTLIAKGLKFRLLWSLDVDESQNASDNKLPHSAFGVYIQDMKDDMIQRFKKDIERCKNPV